MITFNSVRSYTFPITKQGGQLVLINKQVGFKYGNIQMVKSKGD